MEDILNCLMGCGGLNAFFIVNGSPRANGPFLKYLEQLQRDLGKEVWNYVVYVKTNSRLPHDEEDRKHAESIRRVFKEKFGSTAERVPILQVGLHNGDGWQTQIPEFFEKYMETFSKKRFIPDSIKTRADLAMVSLTSLSYSLFKPYGCLPKIILDRNKLKRNVRDCKISEKTWKWKPSN